MIIPAMAYGAECWPIKKQHMHKMDVAEMRMLRWMFGKTRKDQIQNERFREHLGVATIGDKFRETRLRWFGLVQRRPATAPVKRSMAIKVDGPPRERRRRNRTWMEVETRMKIAVVARRQNAMKRALRSGAIEKNRQKNLKKYQKI